MIPSKDEVLNFMGVNSNPMIILHPYKDCNIDCSCCYIKHLNYYCAVNYGEILSDKALDRIIKGASKLHASVYTGSGEPFLHWSDFTLPKLIKLTNEYNIHLILSTNGLWGNNDTIINDIIENFNGLISFSVDFWHKVPIENINHALDRLSNKDIKTMVMMSQITDKNHPLGHIKPHFYENLFIEEMPLNNNYKYNNQIKYYHNRKGDLFK